MALINQKSLFDKLKNYIDRKVDNSYLLIQELLDSVDVDDGILQIATEIVVVANIANEIIDVAGIAPSVVTVASISTEVVACATGEITISDSPTTPATAGEMVFEFTSNTTLTIKVMGSDLVLRSNVLTLS